MKNDCLNEDQVHSLSSRRMSFSEGLELFQHASLEELIEEAHRLRMAIYPEKKVTFVLDSNPNYTNICNADCTFCAFYRKPGAKDSYQKSVDQVMDHLAFAERCGLSTVLLQGGLNDELKIEYYETLVREARKRYPMIHPHFFSPPELWNCARVSAIPLSEVLQRLWDAGQRTIPGGGAEILAEEVREKISPKKMERGGWIEVMRTAHKIGFKTTATMMYGHLEEPRHVLEHLETLRALQEESGGFTAFIPWSYKRERTRLRKVVGHWAGEDAYLRMIAFSRLYLNIPHIQASWFSEGKVIGMRALNSGADDFGGTVVEENVHRATGHIHKTGHHGIVEMIFQAGYQPVQRDPLYNHLRTYTTLDQVERLTWENELEADSLPIFKGR